MYLSISSNTPPNCSLLNLFASSSVFASPPNPNALHGKLKPPPDCWLPGSGRGISSSASKLPGAGRELLDPKSEPKP